MYQHNITNESSIVRANSCEQKEKRHTHFKGQSTEALPFFLRLLSISEYIFLFITPHQQPSRCTQNNIPSHTSLHLTAINQRFSFFFFVFSCIHTYTTDDATTTEKTACWRSSLIKYGAKKLLYSFNYSFIQLFIRFSFIKTNVGH